MKLQLLRLVICFSYIEAISAKDVVEKQDISDQKVDFEYVYWVGAASEGRKPFEIALVKLLFKSSATHFPSGKLVISHKPMTSYRGISKLKKGKELHLITAPPYLSPLENDDSFIILPYPILNNLLGYRQLVIRSEDAKDFSMIAGIKQLAKKTAGQGVGWADMKIYHYNNLPVVQSSSLGNLFSMLRKERFDYLPLGITEALSALNRETTHREALTLVEDFIIFYPWPIYMVISPEHPELAIRLTHAMEEIQRNGQYEKLFKKYFYHVIGKFNRENIKVIRLKNKNFNEQGISSSGFLQRATYLN